MDERSCSARANVASRHELKNFDICSSKLWSNGQPLESIKRHSDETSSTGTPSCVVIAVMGLSCTPWINAPPKSIGYADDDDDDGLLPLVVDAAAAADDGDDDDFLGRFLELEVMLVLAVVVVDPPLPPPPAAAAAVAMSTISIGSVFNLPPTRDRASTIKTSNPRCFNSRAQPNPDTPAPNTMIFWGDRDDGDDAVVPCCFLLFFDGDDGAIVCQ
mmetsp:Transcript_42724/g.103053  ORF Transcript_42724/g.103053 Transcript_42724/m.103053 type:complete len:216 (-) Transcript_42724:30-677(-)